MAQDFDLNNIKKKMLLKYPTFGSIISNVNYKILTDDKIVRTAATDGKTIYVNANYLSSLPEEEQVFIFSHEVCHIGLKHIERSKGKDKKLWNMATDGVINQYLKKDGLKMPQKCVDILDALSYDAEELYEKLHKEQEQSDKQGKGENKKGEKSQNDEEQGGEEGQDGQSGEEQDENENQVGHDDHSMWESVTESKNPEDKQKEQQQEQKEKEKISEKDVFKKNEEEKVKRAEEIMRKLRGISRNMEGSKQDVVFGDIGKAAPPVTSWKKLLRKSLDIEDEGWGHKYSTKETGWAARIEEIEVDEDAESEIILDTSGSVSIDLLKNFLRQVKTILKDSKIKVGTFSDNFNGFFQIKHEADIDNMKFEVGGGTKFNAASEAFTNKKDVNKICFTDGCDGGDAGIVKKRSDIVWICYGNKKFHPDNGKVIYVSTQEINKINISQEEPQM